MRESVVPLDINGGVVKSLVFGLTIILVACYKGYYTKHGAEGVSRATNQTVVLSAGPGPGLGLYPHLLLYVNRRFEFRVWSFEPRSLVQTDS